MRDSIVIQQIAIQAAAWHKANPVPLDVWIPGEPMPANDDKSGTPVRAVQENPIFLRVTPDPLSRAIGLRQHFDPDELSLWAFVPGPAGRVWLVRTKTAATIGNN
jgi:hypothetical protein